MKKLLAAAAFIVVLTTILTACGVGQKIDESNERRGRGDAPVWSVDDTPKDVIQFPDRFSNVAHACDGHGHRVFVTTKSDASRFMVVITDESCAKPDHPGNIFDNSRNPLQSNTDDQ